ncbi:MAG: DnaJ C-terminal domain-containing protein [Burkholderiales bacterium]
MEFKDYYKTLGVAKTADADEIKKAYRKLARKYHPDVSKVANATEKMVELNEANAVLSDPERRVAYDTLGSEPHAQDGREFRPPPNWDAGFEFSGADTDSGLHSDFFEQLFGRAARGQRGGARAGFGGPPSAMRGSDHHAKIELDLLDAYEGADRTITLRSARIDDDGRSVAEERTLQVTIPKGVAEGQHIRLKGRGSPGSGGAASGDLLLEVVFKPDARWRAEGRDVFQRVKVSPWEAALGATAAVRTPSGEAEVSVPAGWKVGRKLRLKGRGIPGTANHAPGNLYLELELALPAADGDASRAAYAAMAKAFPTFEPRVGNEV